MKLFFIQHTKIIFISILFFISILGISSLYAQYNIGDGSGATLVPQLPDMSLVDTLAIDLNYTHNPSSCVGNTASSFQDLQNRINTAANSTGSAVICVTAGVAYSGNLVLPSRSASANGYITILSTKANNLQPGKRISTADNSNMAKISSPSQTPAVSFVAGAKYYRLVGFELTAAPSQYAQLVVIGNSTTASALQIPHHILIDRSNLHGPSYPNQTGFGVVVNGNNVAIANSRISDIRDQDGDNATIYIGASQGPVYIYNNFLEAAGEAITMGDTSSSISGILPENVVVRGNYMYKDASKRGQTNYLTKNILDIKGGRKILIEGNVLENMWRDTRTDRGMHGPQMGEAIHLKSANASCSATHAPWNELSDVTVRYNIIKNVPQVLNIGRATPFGCVDNVKPAKILRFHDNLIIGQGDPTTGKSNFFEPDWPQQVSGIWEYAQNVIIDHNTVAQDRVVGSYIFLNRSDEGATNPNILKVRNFSFRNNIVSGKLDISGATPTEADVDNNFPGVQLKKNIIVGSGQNLISGINTYVSSYNGLLNADYSLVSSVNGTDPLPIGANISMVNTCTAGVTGANVYGGCSSVVPPPPSFISVSLTASPSNMTLPTNSTTLIWTTTGNPTSCTASNFWSGQKTGSGGSEQRTSMPAGTYIFNITCSKAGVADTTDSVTVVVNPENGGGVCINPSSLTSSFATPCPVLELSTYNVSVGGPLNVNVTPLGNSTYFYIFKTFYISESTNACPGGVSKIGGVWCPLSFSGTSVANASNYLTNGSYTLSSSDISQLSNGTHYIISWDWTWNGSCFVGPDSTTCNTGKWRFQAFTK